MCSGSGRSNAGIKGPIVFRVVVHLRVARQIGQHRLRAGEGPLGIDHPLDLAQRREPGPERSSIGQRRLLAKEVELAAVVQLLQFLQEAAPEQPREHSYRQEEPGPARHPGLAFGAEPTAGHDAVHVRVATWA